MTEIVENVRAESRAFIRCIARAAACLASAGTCAFFAPFLASVMAIGTACSPNVTLAKLPSGESTFQVTKPEGNSKMAVHYLEIVSNDADRLTELYRRMHGLSFSLPDPDLGQACVATLADGSLLGIRKPLAVQELPIIRTYLAVENIQHAVAQAEALGAIIAYPPTRQGQRGSFAIVIQGDVQHGLWQR